jgi:hypothetical protein
MARPSKERVASRAAKFLPACAATIRNAVWDRGYGHTDMPVFTGLTPPDANERWTDGRWTITDLVRIAEGIGVDFMDLFESLPFEGSLAAGGTR